MTSPPPSARVLSVPNLTPFDGVASRLESRFTVRRSSPVETALRLRERESDAGVLSPIDIARESSDYMVLRGVGLAAAEPRGPVTVLFRRGVRTVASLAVDPSFSSEIVLASILLAEEFEGAPAIVPTFGTPASMLQHADAVLLVGRAAVESAPENTQGIDLIEAWAELTELPYVYGLWCAREESLNSEERSVIRAVHLGTPAAGAEFTHRIDAEAEEGLREFFRFAFYHGVLTDIPDLHWFDDIATPEADAPAH